MLLADLRPNWPHKPAPAQDLRPEPHSANPQAPIRVGAPISVAIATDFPSPASRIHVLTFARFKSFRNV
jgi:hypothetical protein